MKVKFDHMATFYYREEIRLWQKVIRLDVFYWYTFWTAIDGWWLGLGVGTMQESELMEVHVKQSEMKWNKGIEYYEQLKTQPKEFIVPAEETRGLLE